MRTVWRCLGWLALLACLSDRSSAEVLKAGVARIDLTPPAEMNAALGGYGARMSRPAEGVHDRIFAKALVLDDGTKKLAIVTADVLGFPPPIKPVLVERLADEGFSAESLMLLPSHSHTSIDMSAINPLNVFGIPQIGIYQPRLYDFVLERLTEVIRAAGRQLVPVKVGTASQRLAGWNANRRHRDGPVDDELTITRIDMTDGRPLAVLVNFTAHPTILGPEHMLFSAGWPGQLQRTFEALLDGQATVMYFNGAQGDQRPVARPQAGSSRWEQMQQYGLELGIRAWKLWQRIPTQTDVPFSVARHEYALPEPTWHPQFMRTGGKEYGLTEALVKKLLPRLFPTKTASLSVRLGELVIVGIPGEMAAELGLHIKAETRRITGAAHPVIGGLADEWVSYILPKSEYEKGGYEASVSFYGAELGPRVVEGALDSVRLLTRP